MADKLLEIKGVSKIFRVGGMIRGKKLVAVDDVTLSIDNDSLSSSPSLANPVAASPHCVRWFCVCTTRIWATSCWTANLTAIRKATTQSSSSWKCSRFSRTRMSLSPHVSR